MKHWDVDLKSILCNVDVGNLPMKYESVGNSSP